MAVYTQVAAEALEPFLAGFDVGALVAAKGIAEGVSNSNYLVETHSGRFILTLYEHRTSPAGLPWYLGLMAHLAGQGLPVPRPVADRGGRLLHRLEGRPAALIEYLPGVSPSHPSPARTRAAAAQLARLHLAGQAAGEPPQNPMGLAAWQRMARALGDGLDTLRPGLAAQVARTLGALARDWPDDLPRGLVHADLFPDNVLFLGDEVSGLIDFYFACGDLLAFDLAVFLVAWGFEGGRPHRGRLEAALAGYGAVRPLAPAERAALPLLAQGAALRFLLTRAEDWLDPARPPGVTPKDPLVFADRLTAAGALPLP